MEGFRVDIEKILKEKAPNKKFPRFVVNYLKKIAHQDEMNSFLAQAEGKKNFEFLRMAMREHLNVDATFEGLENLPPKDKGRYIFACNHPLGGLDGLLLGLKIGEMYDQKINFFSNDILMFLEPMKELFIPINKTGAQTRENLRLVNEFYASDKHLVMFPAGKCSRKINGKVEDLQWQKNFVVKAFEHKRDVVPIYFEGRNSNFFYNLSKIRTFFGLPNVEMMYLIDEMYKQRGNHFNVKIGEVIPYSTFDKSKKPLQWAEWVKRKVYDMRNK